MSTLFYIFIYSVAILLAIAKGIEWLILRYKRKKYDNKGISHSKELWGFKSIKRNNNSLDKERTKKEN